MQGSADTVTATPAPAPAPAPVSEAQRRVAWVDYARGIGIVLVVVGHVLRGLVHADLVEASAGYRALDAWIYGFHMPLFFFLAGIFGRRSTDRGTRRFLSDKLRTIAYPYFVWSVLQTSVQIELSHQTNNPAHFSDLLALPIHSVMQFWFFYALFLIFLAVHGLRRLRIPFGAIVAISFAAYVGSAFVDVRWGMALEAIHYLPYFALGAVVGEPLLRRLPDSPTSLLVAGWAVGFGAVAVGVWTGTVGHYFWQPLFAMAGTGGAICFAVLLARGNAVPALAIAGFESLPIYVAHTLAASGTRIVLQKALRISWPSSHIALGIAAGLVAPIVLVRVLDRVGFRYAFQWPKRSPQPAEVLVEG